MKYRSLFLVLLVGLFALAGCANNAPPTEVTDPANSQGTNSQEGAATEAISSGQASQGQPNYNYTENKEGDPQYF